MIILIGIILFILGMIFLVLGINDLSIFPIIPLILWNTGLLICIIGSSV